MIFPLFRDVWARAICRIEGGISGDPGGMAGWFVWRWGPRRWSSLAEMQIQGCGQRSVGAQRYVLVHREATCSNGGQGSAFITRIRGRQAKCSAKRTRAKSRRDGLYMSKCNVYTAVRDGGLIKASIWISMGRRPLPPHSHSVDSGSRTSRCSSLLSQSETLDHCLRRS